VRQRAEDDLGVAKSGVVRGNERNGPSIDARGCPALIMRGSEREIQQRMALNERTELVAGVSTGPQNTHWSFMHS